MNDKILIWEIYEVESGKIVGHSIDEKNALRFINNMSSWCKARRVVKTKGEW